MRSLVLVPLLLALASSAAAGLFGGGPPTRIPVAARDFSATVEDRAGVRVALQRVTLDGEVVVFGDLGLAQVTVPFERVKRVRIEDPGQADAETRVAVVTTVDGEEVRLVVDHDTPLFGRAAFGNYRIEAADIRLVEFSAMPEDPGDPVTPGPSRTR